MAKVEFSEVESDILKDNVIQQQDENTTINKEELGFGEDTSSQGTQHVYIVFAEGVTIDQGIKAIESQVCKGQSLQVTRKDEAGNAVVAIVSSADTKAIESLKEVSLVKIDKGAKTLEEETADKSEGKEAQQTEDNTESDTESTEENTSEDGSEISAADSDNNAEQEVNETTSQVQENDIDTNPKSGYTPVIIAVVLGVVILIGIIVNKIKR